MGEPIRKIHTIFKDEGTPVRSRSIFSLILSHLSSFLKKQPFECRRTRRSPFRVAAFSGRDRKAYITLALLIPALLTPLSLQAGGEPGGFMQWGAGGRSLGMGRAYIAISDDASATYWNPAGLTQLNQKELMGLQATLFEDTSFSFFAYAHPTKKYGTWGLSLTRLQSSGFEKVKVTFDPTSSPDNPDVLSIEKLGDFTVSQQALTVAYGKQVTNKISMGFSLNKIDNTVDTFSQSFMGINASALMKLRDNYRVGLGIRNAVTQAPVDSDDRLPLIIRIGNAYSLLNERILLSADINQSAYDGSGWNVGAEYKATQKIALRLGLENRAGDIAETTAGIGLGLKRMKLDMAIGLTELGLSQRFSLSWKFGRNAAEGRDDSVRRMIQAGKSAFARGQYVTALQRLEAALHVDPSNKALAAMVDKMQGIAGAIPAATGDGEVDRLVRQGVAAYVAGDMQTAYDSLRTAFEKNPSNQRLMNFTNRVARQAGQPLVEPPRNDLSGARWTLVDQKLHDALTAIYEGRYDVAINKCEQVLRIDPSNVTAIGRMGAAFFLLGEKDKAVTLWKRALELEPNNKTAIEYLRQLGVTK